MQSSTLEGRTLSELDHARITRLIRSEPRLDTSPEGFAHSIEAILDSAETLPWCEVAPDVVTMHSRVLVADLDGGKRRALTLCYPLDAEPHSGFVSVLSPMGMSLLGLRTGSVARWRKPGGSDGAAVLVAILFQPEAHAYVRLRETGARPRPQQHHHDFAGANDAGPDA